MMWKIQCALPARHMTQVVIPSPRLRAWLPLLLLLVSCAHKVVSFSVEPPVVCAGQAVEVKWNVQGRASLRIDGGAGESSEELVPSEGERRLVIAKRTTFTIRALDANPADGQSVGTKAVDVPEGPVEKAATSTCDTTSGKCLGTFDLKSEGSGLQVRRIAGPKIVRAGRVQPGTICVSHQGLAPTCVSGDGIADVVVDAAGTWTLETLLPTGVSAAPGPQLRVQLGFGCP